MLKASLESLDDRRGEAFMLHFVQAFYSDSSGRGDLVDLHLRIIAGSQKKLGGALDSVLDNLSCFLRSESNLYSSFLYYMWRQEYLMSGSIRTTACRASVKQIETIDKKVSQNHSKLLVLADF